MKNQIIEGLKIMFKMTFRSKSTYLCLGIPDMLLGWICSTLTSNAKNSWNYYYSASYRQSVDTLSSVSIFFYVSGLFFIVAFFVALYLEKKGYICTTCGKRYFPITEICRNCHTVLKNDRKNSENIIICKACGELNCADKNACFKCGAVLRKKQNLLCKQCGEENAPDTNFCGKCGNNLKEQR